MNLKIKRTICLLVGIASILTILSTVSYAYFTAMADVNLVEGIINTANVSVRFRDYGDEVGGELAFGESITKRFTIENTGKANAPVRMVWIDLINTYLEESLTFTLSYSDDESGPYTEIISKTSVPRSNNPSRKTLADVLTIPVNKTYYYNLEITLNNLPDVDQTADLSAVFNSKFGVEDIKQKYQVTFDVNGGTADVSSKTITENEEYGTLPIPTHKDPNYKFVGWFTEPEGGIQITAEMIVESYTNVTLYAHWKVASPVSKIVNTSKGIRTSFDDPALTDEGIFEMEDDYGTSYYYRGAVENNYVQFAGFYWRIIRLNGDGSMRIIYDGTVAHTNGESNDDRYTSVGQPYNALYRDAKYVGWMYGSEDAVEGTTTASTSKVQAQTNTADSDIKKVVDAWYKTNIEDAGYGQYVSDTLFCNDRQIETDVAHTNNGNYSSYTTLGYGRNRTLYKPASRLGHGVSEPQPIFICGEKNDAFTVSDTSKGNGALEYPVGLITADEIVAAGSGNYGTSNKKYYLYKSSSYRIWSLSPYYVTAGAGAHMFMVNTLNLDFANVDDTTGAVAPVINLSAEYVESMVGDGTMGNPYRTE